VNDPIESILDRLKRNDRVNATSFSSSFLNNVGDVLDKEGFGTAKAFLLEKVGRRNIGRQAQVILEEVIPILETSEKIRARRSIGRYVIKTLNTLKEVKL
jgi:hypothetical protein